MAKKRTMNEIRQEKNYGYRAPDLNGGKEIVDSTTDIKDQEKLESKKDGIIYKEYNCKKKELSIEEIEDTVAELVFEDLSDIIFNLIIDHTESYDEIHPSRFLDDARNDIPYYLEDWCMEFYHEIHGNIYGKIMRKFKTQ